MRPSFRRAHPNFWLVCVAMGLFHLTLAATFLLSSDAVWSAPTYQLVFEWFPRQAWGMAHLAVGIGIGTGLAARTASVVRLYVAIGALLCLIRMIYSVQALAQGMSGGLNAVPIWVLIAVFHLAAASEPATNPANQR